MMTYTAKCFLHMQKRQNVYSTYPHRSAQLFEIIVDCAPLSTNAYKNDKVTGLINFSGTNIQHQGICDRIILR